MMHMQASEENRVKYTYKFSSSAKGTLVSREDESSKEAIQAYVNEILGIKKQKKGQLDSGSIEQKYPLQA
jgi:hypothetical protein